MAKARGATKTTPQLPPCREVDLPALELEVAQVQCGTRRLVLTAEHSTKPSTPLRPSLSLSLSLSLSTRWGELGKVRPQPSARVRARTSLSLSRAWGSVIKAHVQGCEKRA